jgi:hypothetical protein
MHRTTTLQRAYCASWEAQFQLLGDAIPREAFDIRLPIYCLPGRRTINPDIADIWNLSTCHSSADQCPIRVQTIGDVHDDTGRQVAGQQAQDAPREGLGRLETHGRAIRSFSLMGRASTHVTSTRLQDSGIGAYPRRVC